MSSRKVDPIKVVKVLVVNKSMTKDCVLLVDEMYLQKGFNILLSHMKAQIKMEN